MCVTMPKEGVFDLKKLKFLPLPPKATVTYKLLTVSPDLCQQTDASLLEENDIYCFYFFSYG